MTKRPTVVPVTTTYTASELPDHAEDGAVFLLDNGTGWQRYAGAWEKLDTHAMTWTSPRVGEVQGSTRAGGGDGHG